MYTFPQLNNKAILGYLGVIYPQLKLDDKILTDPVDTKTIREVYELSLLNYLDMSREELSAATEDAYEALEFRQLHNKSVAELLLFKQFVSFLNAISIPGFSYQNWIQPNAKSTRHVLSGIINFAKFSEENMEKHAGDTEETEMLKDACEVLDEEIFALEEELKQVKKDIIAEQPERERLCNENEQMKKQLDQLNKTQLELQMICQKKKTINTEVKQQISQLDGEIEANKLEVNHMKAQIVRSPEKVKKRMAEVESNLDKERRALIEAEREFAKSDMQSQVIQKMDGEVESCLHLLRESVHVMEETQKKEQMNKKHRIEYCQLEQQVRDLSSKKENLLRTKESNEEAQARQEAYFLPKIEKAKVKFSELNQEKLKAEKIKSDVTSTMTLEEKKVKTLVLERERLKREYDLQYYAMKEQSEMLDQDLLTYTRALKSLLAESADQEFSSLVSVL